MKHVLVIHGPNLNLSGYRNKEVYGPLTLGEINQRIEKFAKDKGIDIEIFQSNNEGEIIDKIENIYDNGKVIFDAVVINPGAYTHYSYAIRDAIEACEIPCVEVHMSNIYGREEFRNKSVIAPVCKGQISGFGVKSYLLAIEALISENNN